MARPKKGEELGASNHVGVRLPPELRQRLEAIARKNGRTLADEVRAALAAYVAEQVKS